MEKKIEKKDTGILLAFHRLNQSRVKAKNRRFHNKMVEAILPVRLKIGNVLGGIQRETFSACSGINFI